MQKAKEYPYVIKLTIRDCPASESVPLVLEEEAAGTANLDTAQVENGQLVLRGAVAHAGVYKIYCRCVAQKTATIVSVYLPADSVQVEVGTGQNLLPAIYQSPGLGAYNVGSYLRNTRLFSTAPQQREVAAYLQTRDSLWNKFFLDIDRRKTRMNAAIAAGNKPEIDRWADSTRMVQENFPDYLARASALYVKRHPRSVIKLFALLDAGDVRVARQRLRPYYQALPDSVKTSYFGQIAGRRFGQAEQSTGK